ncbi:unnamed protein product, partial [Ectocarpus sp. 8 AP-2014]
GAENCSWGGAFDHQRSCDPVANLRARVSDIILVSGVRKVSCWHVNKVIESLCIYDLFLGLPRGAQAIRRKPRVFEVYRTLLALHVCVSSHVSLGGGCCKICIPTGSKTSLFLFFALGTVREGGARSPPHKRGNRKTDR